MSPDEQFFAAGREWDRQKEVILLYGQRLHENQAIEALLAASKLLAEYAAREERQEEALKQARAWQGILAAIMVMSYIGMMVIR